MIKRGDEDSSLVTKRTVETSSQNAGRLAKVIDRSRMIAVIPENLGSGRYGNFRIKLARPTSLAFRVLPKRNKYSFCPSR